MLKHPDIEVQILVEMLESQRDGAMVQAAALFRENEELKRKLGAINAGDIGEAINGIANVGETT